MRATQQPKTIVFVLSPDITLPDIVGPRRRRLLRRFALAEIALFLYDGMTALDAVGPYEVLARLPDAEVKFVASTPGPKKTDVGLVLTADASLDQVPTPDIIVIPGSGKVPFLEDPAAVEWVRRARDVEVDNLGLHGIDAARRRRNPAGQARDQPLGRPRLPAQLRR
jgi:hypothetical protein